MAQSPITPQQIEAILKELAHEIPDPRVINRRSIITSAGASVLAAVIWWSFSNPRPDPWTGTDAREKHRAQDAAISAVRDDMEAAERALWTLQIQHANLSKRYDALEIAVRKHHERSEGGWEKIKQLEDRAHTHGN